MVRVNLSIGEKELQILDDMVKNINASRSKLIRDAIELYKKELDKKEAENDRVERIKSAIKIQDNLSKYSKDWDGVSEIRKWRESR
jgi:metal-responsive CopG/Arc/MetJ family transcriptional regulator